MGTLNPKSRQKGGTSGLPSPARRRNMWALQVPWVVVIRFVSTLSKVVSRDTKILILPIATPEPPSIGRK